MDLALSSEEMWKGQLQQMRESGKPVNENLTYEQMKDFHQRGEYVIEVPRERHIETEIQVFNTVLRNDQLLQCDSCQRILFSVPLLAPQSTPSAS